MALYNYNKYNVGTSWSQPPFNSYWSGMASFAGHYKSVTWDSVNKRYIGGATWGANEKISVGAVCYWFNGQTQWQMNICTYANVQNAVDGSYLANDSTINCEFYSSDYYYSNQIEGQGSYAGSTVAEDGTYPSNGKHTDGYWYTRGSVYTAPNYAPTVPGVVSFTGALSIGNEVTFTWGVSTDPEGGTVTYSPEVQLFRNSVAQGWANMGVGTSVSRKYTIPNDNTINAIEVRVRAYDPANNYSGYRTTAQWFVVSNKVPTIMLSTTENRIINENDTFVVNGSASDTDVGNVVTTKYQINNDAVQTIVSATSDGTSQIPFSKTLTFKGSKLYDGLNAITTSLSGDISHTLKVWSEDNKGGKSTEEIRNFTVIPVVKNKLNPSITVNPKNEIFIVYEDYASVNDSDIAVLKNINGLWAKESVISTTDKEISPSALYDSTYSTDFKGPSFIYENVSEKRVGYYGEWEYPVVDYDGLPNMIDFDGIDDYLKIPNRMIPKDNDFTIEFFFKTKTGNGVIFQISEKITNYSQLVVGMKDGKLELWVTGSNIITESEDTYNDGKLHHAVVRKTGEFYELIIDGNRVVSRIQNTIFAENCYITIGAATDSDGNKHLHYEGQISPPRFWDDPRTIKELIQYKDVVVPDDEQGLIDYFIFDPITGELIGKKTGIPVERNEATWTSKFVAVLEAIAPFPLSSQKSENINGLRKLVNKFREDNGLEKYSWTDPIIVPKVTVIKAIHWNELQTATLEVYSVTGEVLYNKKVEEKLEEVILPRNTRYRIDGLGERISNIIQALRNEEKGGS